MFHLLANFLNVEDQCVQSSNMLYSLIGQSSCHFSSVSLCIIWNMHRGYSTVFKYFQFQLILAVKISQTPTSTLKLQRSYYAVMDNCNVVICIMYMWLQVNIIFIFHLGIMHYRFIKKAVKIYILWKQCVYKCLLWS